MPRFQFRDRIPIDIPHTLMQLLSRFQGVKDGLPELIKNSKDQYSRLGITDPALRVIVVAINTADKSIGVIDFAGASADQFSRWETWSDPAANERERAADIEGGHGNGGKAFMVLGSVKDSIFESCINGKRTRMGYENDSDDKRFRPGIALEHGTGVEDQPVSSPLQQFKLLLEELGITFEQLPSQARRAFLTRQAYTVALVNGIEDWSRARGETIRRSVLDLPHSIEMHPQAALTLDSCSVWFLMDGQLLSETPAQARFPDPFVNFAEPVIIPVPGVLPDPQTRDDIDTGAGDESQKLLTLRTSARSLRMEDMRALHVIRCRNSRNVVGLWSVADLHPGAASGFIFGELRVPALEREHLAGADRTALNDTPLVRALRLWVGEQIKELADQIQSATARDHSPEERDKVNQSLNEFRNLMREFLEEREGGTDGAQAGQQGAGPGGSTPTPPQPRPRGERVDIIEIEGGSNSIAFALGASVPLRVKVFEQKETGELYPVPNPDLAVRFNEMGIARVDPESFVISGLRPGIAELVLATRDGRVESNRIAIEVVECVGATIAGVPERLLLQGEHVALKITYTTPAGQNRDDLLHEASVDEIGMGRISRSGSFVAGAAEGTATVRVRWGTKPPDTASTCLRIGTERVPPRRGIGGDQGGQIPLILLCGTPVPGMDHYPLDQRTIPPADHLPTIIDFDPAFENVIFINPDSKESAQVRRGRGGRRPMASIANATYYQFVALKCFEILKRLWVFQQAREAPLTEFQFRERFATAETECAPFIEAAYRVAENIAGQPS